MLCQNTNSGSFFYGEVVEPCGLNFFFMDALAVQSVKNITGIALMVGYKTTALQNLHQSEHHFSSSLFMPSTLEVLPILSWTLLSKAAQKLSVQFKCRTPHDKGWILMPQLPHQYSILCSRWNCGKWEKSISLVFWACKRKHKLLLKFMMAAQPASDGWAGTTWCTWNFRKYSQFSPRK